MCTLGEQETLWFSWEDPLQTSTFFAPLTLERSEIILCGARVSANFGHMTERIRFTWRWEVSEGHAQFGLDGAKSFYMAQLLQRNFMACKLTLYKR